MNISKKQYIKQQIRNYLEYCKTRNTSINFLELRNLKKQWEFEYDMQKLYGHS